MTNEKKHILIVSQYFYPENFRINDICLDLIKRGFKVTVLTGYPNYPEGEFFTGYKSNRIKKDKYKEIDIIRVPIIARGKNKITLALNYASFVASGYYWQIFNDIEADSVFIYEVSPMTQALPGVWYAKKNDIPCYLYVMDLWPENVQIAGEISNPLIINMIGKLVDYIYDNSDRILTSSSSFISRIISRGISEDKIEFWPQYAEDYYKPIPPGKIPENEIPADNVLNLTFAGNIGYAQGLDILPKVAKKFKKENRLIRFNIVGDGRYKNEFIDLINNLSVSEYFNLIEGQPAEKIKEYMARSDASLVILSKNELFKLTIPAKVQSSLACGTPIIGSVSGETKLIIDNSGAGLASEAGDIEGLYDVITKFNDLSKAELIEMKNKAITYYNRNFEKNKMMNRLETILNIGMKV